MNNTTKFLYAFYSNFGKEFKAIYNSNLKVLQLYLGDYNYKNYDDFSNFSDFVDDDLIFVVVDKRSASFEKSMLAIQTHQNYIADYELNEQKHVIVLQVTDEHRTALRYFKMGKYSKMYPPELVEKNYVSSVDFLAKYGMSQEIVTKLNCSNLIGTQFNYSHFILSTYHVAKKSKELRELLECVYNCNIDSYTELMEKIRLEKEVLNYEQHAKRSGDLIGNHSVV